MKKLSFLWLHRNGWLLILGVFGGYVLAFARLERWTGLSAAAFVTIPVFITAWLYGMGWGLLAALGSILLNTLLFNKVGYLGWNVVFLQGGTPGTIALILITIFTGRMSALALKEKQEINKRLTVEAHRLDTTQRQAKTQAALLQLSTDLAVSLDEKNICRRVVDSLCQALGYDYLGFYLVDEVSGDRVLQHSAGWPDNPDITRIPPGRGITERPILDGQLHYTPDVRKDPAYIPAVGSGSEVDIPIWIGEKVAGILAAEKKEPHAFDQVDFDVLSAAANLAGLALTRALLFSTERRQFEELAVLHAIAMAVTEATNEDDLIERSTQIISKNLFPDSFGILLLDESASTLRLHSTYRFREKHDDVFIPLGQGITGQVAQEGQPLRTGDVTQISNYLLVDPQTRSELCVPIKLGQRVIGVINAESAKQEAFTEADERLMITLAGQLATTIDGLRTAEAERKRAAELARSNALIRALGEVAARINSAPDLDNVLHTLGVELKKLDLACLVASCVPGTQELAIRYTSLEHRTVRVFERASRIKIDDLRVPMARLSPHADMIQKPRPTILTDPLGAVMDFLGGYSKQTVVRALKSAGLTQDSPAAHFPLMIEDKLQGLLWLWGKSLREDDLPAMAVFANQVAVAIENARLFSEVQRLAVTDELTGLNNRRQIFELGRAEFYRARRYGRSLSAIYLDIDHFKDFNDTYGHAIGDIVLQVVADLCKRNIRDADILARFGGEEFVILLPETDRTGARAIAERLRKVIADNTVPTEKGDLGVTVSLGVVECNDDTPDLETLIMRADKVLYEAKYKGRNRVIVEQ